MPAARHSLRGLCGLKLPGGWKSCPELRSQPARAVWIEIAYLLFSTAPGVVTACEGCVD